MYDIIIIGAGTAGISAYKAAIKHTNNILIVNDGPWDTTCARVGCMPSKALISTANRLHDAKTADAVGLNLNISVDTSQVMPHVRQLRDRFTNATLKDVNNWPKHHKVSGKAQFINENTIIVNGEHYQAKSFILAVGSTPNINLEWQNILGDRYITTDQIFELKQLPKNIAVIGSGVIAIELAQAMQRLGVQTTVFARSKKVGILTSPSLQQVAQQELAEELDFKFEILPESVNLQDNQVEIKFIEHEQIQTLKVDYLLSAIGRNSLLKSLKLENIHPEFTNSKSLPVDIQTKQLAKFPIFIVGDAHTSTPLQHEAAHEGKAVVKNCLDYPKVHNIKTLTPLGIVFSSPEMGLAGQSYQQLIQANIEFVTGIVSYEKQGRALTLGKNQGKCEFYIDKKTHKILGAEFFVAEAEHFAHLFAWLIGEELRVDDILIKPFYHPTLEEGIRTGLKYALRELVE